MTASALAAFTLPPKRSMVERVMFDATTLLAPAEETEAPVSDLPQVAPMTEYQQEPLRFFVERMGIPEHTIRWSLNAGYGVHEWDGTPDPLISILDGLVASDDVAVESGTGTGKSFLGALIILWFIAAFYEARVFTFAPKEEQLRAYIWMEIGRLWPRFQILFPAALLTDLRIRMRGLRDEAWGARGYAVGVKADEEIATNAQGMHAEHMLLVYEEAPGISPAVIAAGENTCTAPHNLRLALGNPDHQLDGLHLFGHDEFGSPRPGVRNVRISALDHPNIVGKDASIVPGAASEKSVRWRTNKYGPEHRTYKSRVRGISPAEATDALIKLEWIQRAQRRWADAHDKLILTNNGRAKRSLGVDVANSEDGDEGAIASGIGAYLEKVESFPCPDANALGRRVVTMMREQFILDEHVGVDDVGVGAGTFNECKRLGRYVQGISGGAIGMLFGESEEDEVAASERFKTRRAQEYWRLAEDLRLDKIALPPNVAMATDLVTVRWKRKGDFIVIEPKEDLKNRLPGGRSPNEGDAVVYWNAVRDRAPVLSVVPKKHPTQAQRLLRELERLDQHDPSLRDERNEPPPRVRYGNVLRQ